MKRIVFAIALLMLVAGSMHAQSYKQVKITLSNGLLVKGSNALIQGDTITVKSGGYIKSYDMGNVVSIQAKDGKASVWALGCGGGCMALCLVTTFSQSSEDLDEQGYTVGQYLIESLLYSGLSAGVGYAIGALIDSYDVVYIKQSSLLKRMHLDVSTINPLTVNMPSVNALRLSYRF